MADLFVRGGARAVSLARVQSFSISLDGFGTGEGLSREEPFGHAGDRLHEWMFTTRWWHELQGEPGGSGGIDDAVVRLHDPGVGAETWVRASSAFPVGTRSQWKGWWGDNPPFHTPVFVLTHHTRPPIEMEGGTTFHFTDAAPTQALEAAREAARGQDVRIGAAPPRSASSLLPDSWTRCTSSWSRSCSAAALPVGRARKPREGLCGRGYRLPERRHPSDVQPGIGLTPTTLRPPRWQSRRRRRIATDVAVDGRSRPNVSAASSIRCVGLAYIAGNLDRWLRGGVRNARVRPVDLA